MFPVRLPTIEDVLESIKSKAFWEGVVFGAAVAIGLTWYVSNVSIEEKVGNHMQDYIGLKDKEIKYLKDSLNNLNVSLERERLADLNDDLLYESKVYYEEKFQVLTDQLSEVNFEIEWAIKAINGIGVDESEIQIQQALLENLYKRASKIEEQIVQLDLQSNMNIDCENSPNRD